MTDHPPRRGYPWWVRITLMAGGKQRRGQWLYVALSLLAAGLCAALPLVLDLRPSTSLLLAGGALAFLLTAGWYVLSLRWIDRCGSWGAHG